MTTAGAGGASGPLPPGSELLLAVVGSRNPRGIPQMIFIVRHVPACRPREGARRRALQ
jgi:hypothetical protein